MTKKLVLDELFAYKRIKAAGLSECEQKEVQVALDQDRVIINERYIKETLHEVNVRGGRLEGQISFGTANPVPIEMEHVVSNSDGTTHVGILGEEYPRRKYRGYAGEWFMLVQLSA